VWCQRTNAHAVLYSLIVLQKWSWTLSYTIAHLSLRHLTAEDRFVCFLVTVAEELQYNEPFAAV